MPIPRYFILFFGALAGIVPFAIDAYLPAIEMMSEEFDTTVQRLSLTISIFLIGYAVGQFFGGPLSDQVGRKTMGLLGMGIFMLSTIGIIWAGSVDQIMALRFVQAIGGGFTSVIGMASMRDVYPAHEAGRKFAIVVMIMLAMPLLAPFLGTALIGFGWQAIFVALFIFVAFMFCWMYFGMPETRVVENKKVDIGMIFRQFVGVVTKRTDEGFLAVRYVWCTAFVGGVLLIFVTNSSFLYMEYFGVSEQHFPFYFGANVLLMVLTVRYSMRRMKLVHPHRLFMRGNAIQLVCTALLFTYVLLFDAQLYPTLALMVVSVGTMGLVSPNAAAIYISYYDQLSGSATSVNSMTILLVGGVSGAIVASLLGDSIVPMAAGMVICSLLSNLMGWSLPAPTGDFKKS